MEQHQNKDNRCEQDDPKKVNPCTTRKKSPCSTRKKSPCTTPKDNPCGSQEANPCVSQEESPCATRREKPATLCCPSTPPAPKHPGCCPPKPVAETPRKYGHCCTKNPVVPPPTLVKTPKCCKSETDKCCVTADDECDDHDLTAYGKEYASNTGKLISECICVKFNGLQDSCRHPDCCTKIGCLDDPYPTCPPARKWKCQNIVCERTKKRNDCC